ncbi:MAG: mechanosensitive ion channel family protein [Planctomycetota bacterium]
MVTGVRVLSIANRGLNGALWLSCGLALLVCLAARPTTAQSLPGTGLTGSSASAGEAGSAGLPTPPITLASPRQTIATFIDGMHQVKRRGILATPPDYDLALTAIDFGPLTDIDERELADELYAVINRIEFVDYAKLKAASDAAVATGDDFVYFPAPPGERTHRLYGRTSEVLRELKLGSLDSLPGAVVIARSTTDGAWRFTTGTMREVPELYQTMRVLPPVEGVTDIAPSAVELIEANLPTDLVAHGLLGLKYWQWIAIVSVIFIGLALDLIVRAILGLVARRLAGQAFIDQDEDTIRKTMRPLGLLAMASFWLLLIGATGLEGVAFEIINGALAVFASLAGIASAWRLVDLVSAYFIFKATQTKTRVDDVLIPLIRKTLKIFVVVLGVVYVARAINIDIWPLVASLGIGSVAFAFAAKDTVENFFGSIAVLLDRPFHVGDWVVIEGHEGIVEEVGFRSTRVRTFYNSQVTIPNSNLVRAVVDNYGRRRYRRWKTMLGVQYDTSPEQLAAFTEGIRELIRLHPYTRKDYYQVYCNEFGESSLQVLLYMFFEVPDWNTELRERDRLFRDIVRLADALGVSFAFPTQTVHLFKEEHRPPSRDHEDPDSLTDGRASVWGIRAAKGITRNQAYVKTKPDPVVIQTDASDDEPAEELDDAGNPIEKPEEENEDTTDENNDERPNELKGGG